MAGGAQEEGPPCCVVAHFFQTATSYLCAAPECELAQIEGLCREELLPERILASSIQSRTAASTLGFQPALWSEVRS